MSKHAFDTLIKVGGSISEKGSREQFKSLCQMLYNIYINQKRFLGLSGGGIFAELVRKFQKDFDFTDEIAHWMAIYGMEQHSLLLKEFIPHSEFICVIDFKEMDSYQIKKMPILKVMNFMRKISVLEHNWNTTSDAIACEIASYLDLKQIIFVKDVDGVYIKEALVPEIRINELMKLKISPLDSTTPKLLKRRNINGYIINGFYPSRLKDFIDGKEIICTKLIC